MSKSISLCIITKNEQEFIERCVKSVRDFVTEIIVVDTGSTDDTVAKVEAMGGKVFHFAWNNNFSDARNLALSHARGDWILVLDADEVMLNPEEIQRLINFSYADGYYVTIKNLTNNSDIVSEDMVVRLFKNEENYAFSGAIHEQIAGSILVRGKKLQKSALIINHFGYIKEVIVRKDKFRRNLRIIRKQLKKNPCDSFLNYSLAMEYYQVKRVHKGIACLEKALEHMDGTEGYYKDVVTRYILGLLSVHKYREAVDYAATTGEKSSKDADVNFLCAIANFEIGNLAEALKNVASSTNFTSVELCPIILDTCFIKEITALLLAQLEVYQQIFKECKQPLCNCPVEVNISKLFNFFLGVAKNN